MKDMKYLLYARKSSESEDRQVLSIASQIDELKALARKQNLKIVDIISESKSAKAPGRKEFNRMLEQIHSGEADAILCWKLDRLARNPIDGGQICWMLQQGVIKHIQAYGSSYNPQDNVLLMSVEFGMANEFLRQLSENTKRGMRRKVQEGWLPGVSPLGYLNSKFGEKGKNQIIMKDPDKFPLVRKLWDLMLTGNYTAPKILDIANNEWGFKTRKFKRQGGKPLSRSRIYSIFTNSFYTGLIKFNGELYPGKHEPMITAEEYDKVQFLLGRKGRPRPKTHCFAFVGMIVCGECHSFVTAEEKYKPTKSGIHHYIYYHCTKRKPGIKCSQPCIRQEELERQIKEKLSKITIDEDFKNLALKYLRGVHGDEVKDRGSIQESLHKTYEDTQKQIDNLTKLRLKEMVTDEEYTTQKSELLKERAKLKEKIGDFEHRADRWLELTEKAFNFACYAKYWFENGSLEDKKIILQTVGSNFILKDKRLSIELKNPWIIIRKGLEEAEQEMGRLELPQPAESTTLKPSLIPVCKTWLPGQDSNLRHGG